MRGTTLALALLVYDNILYHILMTLKESEHITLPEGLILLQNSGLSTEEAKVRLRQAFVRKAFSQAPLFAFEYDDADIDWATGSVKISKPAFAG